MSLLFEHNVDFLSFLTPGDCSPINLWEWLSWPRNQRSNHLAKSRVAGLLTQKLIAERSSQEEGPELMRSFLHKRQMLTMLKLEPNARTHAVRRVQSDDDTGLQEKTKKSVRATSGVIYTSRRALGSCHFLGAKLFVKNMTKQGTQLRSDCTQRFT